MKHKIIVQITMICLGLCSVLSSTAQDTTSTDAKKWAVQFNLKHQDLPIEIFIGQLGVVHDVNIRPFYSLDFQRAFQRKNPKKKFFLTGQLGYFNNLYQDRWLTVKVGLGFERKIGKNFFYSSRFEIGKVNHRNADVQYIYEDSKWIPTSNYSKGRWTNSYTTRIDFGYKLLKGKYPIDLIISGDLKLMEHPDYPGFIAAFPYYAYGGGVRYRF